MKNTNSMDTLLKLQKSKNRMKIISIIRISRLLKVSRVTANILIIKLLELKRIVPVGNPKRTNEKLYEWQNN